MTPSICAGVLASRSISVMRATFSRLGRLISVFAMIVTCSLTLGWTVIPESRGRRSD